MNTRHNENKKALQLNKTQQYNNKIAAFPVTIENSKRDMIRE